MLNKIQRLFFSNVRGDFFGGITAGIVALPLALAFGVQSGFGAEAGLYGAMALGILAAIFGGTPSQISGPTGPMTVVSAVFIATTIESTDSFEAATGLIIATFLLAGAFQVVLSLFRIGDYIMYIPYPVLSGFMSGIGVIIILLQIFPLMGVSSPATILHVFINLPDAILNINYQAVLLAGLTIAIIYLFPRITNAIPGTLVALVVVSIIPLFIPMDIAKIGDIPSGWPELRISSFIHLDWPHLPIIIAPAITLAALGAIDSLLTSVVADNITKTRHDSNRELIGQGIGNMAAALIGGIPGAGATMRTMVNVKSGGRSRLSGVIHGILLLVILLGAGQYAAEIPLSVLAGILITVGIGIIDYKGFRHLTRIPRADAAVTLIVLAATVFIDLLQAVGIGVVLSAVLFMKKMSDASSANTKMASLGKFEQEKPWEDEGSLPAEIAEQIYVKHLFGPLFFGFTSKFRDMARSVPQSKVVIIRMERVPFIDQSGLYAMEEVIMSLIQKDITVAFTGIREQPKELMKKIELIPALIPEEMIFENFRDCLRWAGIILKTSESPREKSEVKRNEELIQNK